jgi:peptide-methionine (S)-S-oxide reductase
MEKQLETALFAGGCFWCLEALFSRVRGVLAVQSGYCGGDLANPDYQQVCSGRSGHAEAVSITFDASVLSYATLLEVFFASHDPTTLNRQGHDIGTQYRSAIFYHSEAQKAAASAAMARATTRYGTAVVTELSAAGDFYPAEAEHQNYYRLHQQAPYCQMVIAPKLATLLQNYATLTDA